jgi:uncharacterized membrane protein
MVSLYGPAADGVCPRIPKIEPAANVPVGRGLSAEAGDSGDSGDSGRNLAGNPEPSAESSAAIGCCRMDTLRHYLTQLRASLLVVPLLMSIAALVAAWMLLGVEIPAPAAPTPWWLHVGSAQGAKNLLGALLTGIVTMFSLVLSITMVVLTLAAQQMGSRLIRNFLDDVPAQVVIGLLLASLLYMLAVLAAIDDDAQRVPHVAVTGALLLSGLCLPALLYYVDRLAHAIMFDHAANRVVRELRATCEHMQREADRQASGHTGRLDAETERAAIELAERGAWLPMGRSGYVQSIGYDALVEAARRSDAQIFVAVRPGQWINAQTPCVAVLPAASPELARRIRRAIIVGIDRTPAQDLEYGLQRLVEMAVRALSPGVNDVFTALAAIDNLSASVAMIFSRPAPSRTLHDSQGGLRLIRTVSDPAILLGVAFDQVRQAGAAMPAVGIRLFDALARLAPIVHSDVQRDAVLEQIEAVLASARSDTMIARDVEAIRERYRRAHDSLSRAKS